MDNAEVKQVLRDYFDGLYYADAEKINKVFHDASNLYGIGEDGALRAMTKDAFVNLVGSEGFGEPRQASPQDEILSIDFTGDNTAVARVKVRVGKMQFTDILCLMQIEGKWGIISKVYAGIEEMLMT